jgi:hypothetical protein
MQEDPMNPKRLLLPTVALLLVALACSFTVNLPRMNTGDLVTEEINIPVFEEGSGVVEVQLNFGAGDLNIEPGTDEFLISGTAAYNVPELKPEITVRQSEVIIAQEGEGLEFIPVLGGDFENTWDLQLGTNPVELIIAAGGYRGDFELGGLSIQSLRISEGGSNTSLSFSEPNLAEMDLLRFETGASKVVATGLANANFSRMELVSGAGDYTLDFSGELQRDGEVTVKSGFSNITLIVPQGMSVNLRVSGGLSNVNVDGDWQTSGDNYIHEGAGPQLVVSVEMGAGNLNLDTQ